MSKRTFYIIYSFIFKTNGQQEIHTFFGYEMKIRLTTYISYAYELVSYEVIYA